MSMFSLGTVDLMVQSFDGFDRPNTAQLVTVLSDGVSTHHQVLQSGSVLYLQAGISGVVVEPADIATLRGYADSHETVLFTDGNGNTTDVRVLEFSAKDLTLWWEFSAMLLESDEETVSQPGTALAASAAKTATNIKVDSVAGLVAGDSVRIGYLGRYETRTLTTVGTSGSGGTGLSFTDPLDLDHAVDERVVEVSGS
jgi:hypothetical protein